MNLLKLIKNNYINNKINEYPDVITEIVRTSLINTSPIQANKASDIKFYSNYFNGNTSQGTMPPPGEHKFLSVFEESRSNPNYKDFTYFINDCGFRDQLPDENSDNIFGFFGCSFTFGEGLDSKDNFPHLISQHYNKKCLNLGQTGTGASRIALTFAAAANIWNIETAIVTLPNWARFHYVDVDCSMKSLHLPYEIDNIECNTIREFMVEHFSDQYMLAATKDAINYIITVAKLKNIKLILTSWDPDVAKIIQSVSNYEAPIFSMIESNPPSDDDKARDYIHPGITLVNRQVTSLIQIIDRSYYVNE